MLSFIDREEEMHRLDALMARKDGGLAVVYGRRRLGKTRLLLEWARRHGGLHTVADRSTSAIQRRYLAEAIDSRLPGFAAVEYPTWDALLGRLAREARAAKWRGPIVLDELPYLASEAPELPSVLQRYVDGPAREARLVVAIAGSSQRMMQGIVLAAEAPLFGRAQAVLEVAPLAPKHLSEALGSMRPAELVHAWCAWGGVPRYWELAAEETGPTAERFGRLVLDPLGPLHREPDRLLIEETPPAVELRPILDAIGSGAHRVSEIAGRIGRPATSLSRPLDRLQQLGLVARDVPFGESERTSRRSLYRIADPFFRAWFRLVAGHRAALVAGTPETRRTLTEDRWPALLAATWEDLCRRHVATLPARSPLAKLGPWMPASRWWHGNLPEWDVISESLDHRRLLLGEAWWTPRPATASALERAAHELVAKPVPDASFVEKHEVVRALFVPDRAAGVPARPIGGVHVVTAGELLDLA